MPKTTQIHKKNYLFIASWFWIFFKIIKKVRLKALSTREQYQQGIPLNLVSNLKGPYPLLLFLDFGRNLNPSSRV